MLKASLLLSVLSILLAFQFLFMEAFDPLEEQVLLLDECPFKVPPPDMRMIWADNRRRLLENYPLRNGTAILIEGAIADATLEDGITAFRQSSDFVYLIGVSYPGLKALISSNGSAVLYLPVPRDIVFDAALPSRELLLEEYSLLDVKSVTELQKDMTKYGRIVTLKSDTNLKEAVSRQRESKSELEVAAIRFATESSAKAHSLIHSLLSRSAEEHSEYSLYSTFLHLTTVCGNRIQAYEPTVAFGEHAARLHYQNSIDKQGFEKLRKPGFLLIDAGANHRGYATDITRTYPVGVVWTDDMKDIYSIVLEANMKCIEAFKKGVSYLSLPAIAKSVIFKGLKRINVLKANSSEDVVLFFFPHGLGHTVGIDVHDLQKRYVLKVNDIWTIEPGVYFNEELLKKARSNPVASKQINWEKVNRLLEIGFGGVRIEDMVLVTEDGNEVLSKDAPKFLF
ncbi:hypothetical protein MP638_002923 [Amoeboaphelidium occidentale]|nr:hypothetical protein MP638_002923 [Amoeboaphelidium occidentale]